MTGLLAPESKIIRKKEKTMRNKKAAYLCTVVMLLMTAGCGHSDMDSDVLTVDTINVNDVIDKDTEENNSINQNVKENIDNQQDRDEKIANEEGVNKQTDNVQLQSDSELDGTIESIADNSMIINKTLHPSENISVSYGDDSEKPLVTVYFSEKTEFEVRTVKNGGVNGDTDTEKRQGTFSDLKQDAYIDITGSYDGNDFHASHIVIYNFV